MHYCIYLRKSRADLDAEARGEGETLARHERALLELSQKYKLNITQIHREIVSGETIASRPIMQQLINEVEQGLWSGVLVMEVERLARGDTMDQGIVAQTFKYSNTKIITPMKIYDPTNEYDEEYFEFGLFMSRREYKTINRRLQNGRITSVKEGKFLGTVPPYGYKRKKLDKQKGFTLEAIPDQSEIVKLIFELYTKGEQQPDGSYKRIGVALIVRKLNDLKIPTIRGDVWVNATIQGILRNPVYIGKIRWNSRPTIKKMIDGHMTKERPRAKLDTWILVDGLHEAIIDNNTWEAAQDNISNNRAKPCPKDLKTQNPLSGLIVCGMCGRRMVRRPYNNRQPDTLMCASTACKNVSSQLSFVEKKLLDSLGEWLNDHKVIWKQSDKETQKKNNIQWDVKQKAIKKHEDELVSLEKQVSNLHDLLEQGVYTTEKFLERDKLLANRISEAQQSKDSLSTEFRLEDEKEIKQTLIIPKIEKLLSIYNTDDDPEYRNHLLKEVLDKAVYYKTVNGRWHNRPDDFELELFPYVPK